MNRRATLLLVATTASLWFGAAHSQQPREIPLRYDPPPPWYRRPWVWIGGGGALAAGAALVVYAVTVPPPDRVSGTVTVR